MRQLILLLLIVFLTHMSAQTYVKIPDAAFVTYLQGLVPSAMNGDSLDTSNSLVTTSTHTINVKGLGVNDLTGVQYFTSLTYLKCSQSSLTSLPPLPSTLQYLYCGNSALTSLPTLPASLTRLYCDTNQLSNLPALPSSLKYLSCGFNQLTSIPTLPNGFLSLYCCANNITGLPTLPSTMFYLNCTVNSLNSLPPSLPNSILYLYLGDNNLSSLPPLPNQLQYFWCDYNFLTTIPTLPSTLQYFKCYHNSITSLPALPSSLLAFDCSTNNITCFPTFPNSITSFSIDPNPYNCLPNHISAMNATDLAKPLCAAGNSNGCPVATGIEEVLLSDISIFPNPTNGELTIDAKTNDKCLIQIFNLDGTLILSQSIYGKTDLDLSALDNGVYNLAITSGHDIANKRLVIMRQ